MGQRKERHRPAEEKERELAARLEEGMKKTAEVGKKKSSQAPPGERGKVDVKK